MTVTINGTSGITTPSINAAAGNSALTTVSVAGNNISAVNSLGFRNRILNGDMRIDQRNAGASVTANDDTYAVDRFKTAASLSSKLTAQRNAGAVTPPAGFSNYLGYTSSSAYSIGSSDYFVCQQGIEGFNVADLAWGTAGAQAITLSFWVRSSLTGTFGGALRNADASRSYPFTYAISAANTWEQKTVNIAGDTSGTWGTGNGNGISLGFGLGVGSTLSGTAGSWAAANYRGATGATSVVGTSGATFYITGVQLEAGSVASPFERTEYGAMLRACQRYYYTTGSSNFGYMFYSAATATSNYITAFIQFPVPMRATPTVTGFYDGVSGKLGYMTSGASFAATSTNVYGIAANTNLYGQINLYGVSAIGIRGDYTASIEL